MLKFIFHRRERELAKTLEAEDRQYRQRKKREKELRQQRSLEENARRQSMINRAAHGPDEVGKGR